ncbi:MAG: TIGR04255 family protein [Motiliproteus sp.]
MNDRLRALKTPPLVYTLAVVRFSDVQKISDYVPDIQEALRRKYPEYTPTTIRGVTIEHDSNGESKVSTNESMQWSFVDAERQWGVLLQSNLILFHTSVYGHFDTFGQKLAEVLDIVSSKADITHYHTLGLRYIDAISAKSGKKLSDYVSEELLPLQLSGVESSSSQNRTENRYSNDLGTLFIRSHTLEAGDTIPADLKETAGYLEIKNPHCAERFVILDTDHVHQSNESGRVQLRAFNTDQIVSTINKMHCNASCAFKSAVTDEAIKEWSEG